MEVLFVAAENGAIEGGKVGGIGDVIRDLPPALAAHGCRVTVVIPSHGYLHLGLDSTRIGAWRIGFTQYPPYARDIRQPSRKPQFYGGEGLEADLEQVHREGRLICI